MTASRGRGASGALLSVSVALIALSTALQPAEAAPPPARSRSLPFASRSRPAASRLGSRGARRSAAFADANALGRSRLLEGQHPSRKSYSINNNKKATSRGGRSRSFCQAESTIEPGTKVKVKEGVEVYHFPGHKGGFDIGGLEGTVVEDVTVYKGTKLSPTLPLVVEFQIESIGPRKLKAHLAPGEVETI
eukprot:CAMPEP_0114518938 /NCGR_PEP_ID=MMETSP0109-20121206/18717_1 /TAXON_ID=29199 /ORGANISM="Chlorarachnion reptans, Strain CCCM449" /LENGTH=190 /DNA_ID=CAMNT_0001699605 /DNA_START=229 /DNA_END=801 /DNA_ORIENTATION=-